MKHLKLFFALFAMLALGVGNAWGATYTGDFVKITSVNELTTGYYVIVASESASANSYAVGSTVNSNKRIGGVSVTIVNDKITNPDNKIVYYITKVGSKYTFQNVNTSKYLYQASTTSGKGMGFDTSSKEITCAGYSTNAPIGFKFTLNGASNNFFKWNNSSKWFANYANDYSASMAPVRLYKLASAGGEEPETPTPSISVTPASHTFATTNVGKTATQEFTITAENTTAALSASIDNTTDFAISAITGDKVTVTYQPQSAEKHTATMTVKAGEEASATVSLTGNGVQSLEGTWELVTDASILKNGDQVIIAAKESNIALSTTQNNNNRAGVEVTKSGNTISATSATQVLTLVDTEDSEVPFALQAGSSYLYAASSSGNQLKTKNTLDNHGKWVITITDGTASVVASKSSNRNVMQYNPNNGNPIFTCYSSASQSALSLYRKAGTKYNVNISATTNGTVTADPTSAEAGTTITLTVTPVGGYVLDALTVTDASSNPVTVTDNKFTMPASDVTVTATFKANEKPAATLTLSKNGVEESFPGSWKQDDVVTLPSITSDCVKEFVGWSANPTCNVAPEYAAGDSYTLAATAQTLYAVYATAGAGETLTITPSAVSGSADPYTFTIDAAGYSLTAKKNSGSTAPTYNDGKADARVYAQGTVTLTAPKALSQVVFNLSTQGLARLAPITVSVGDIATQAIGDATVTWTGDATEVTFTVGDKADFGSDGSSKGGQLCFSTITVTTVGSYSNYSTTCAAALANPTFSLAEGKYTEAKSVEIEYTEGTVYYTMDGTDPTASSTQYTAAIALNDCGEYTIKAIAISSDSQSDVVSATYTIKLPLTNSQAAPYTEAEAIAVYDGDCYDNQDVYVKGTVKTATFNSTYGNYTITLTNGFQFYRFLQAAETKFTEDIIVPGDVLVACGKLSKYQTTYQLAEGCYLVERIPYEGEKTDISNTEATAYTVDKAFELIADVSSDLTKEVYVKGFVAVAPTSNPTDAGKMTYSISDDGEKTGKVLKVYLGLGIDGAKFTSKDDVKQGDYVVAKGKLLDYSGTYELTDNQLVQHVKAATISIADITMEVGETKTIAATVTPADAVVTYAIKENAESAISLDGTTITANAVGTATITATIATTADYMGKTVEFTVTVTPKTDKEKVVILAQYEGQWYAMMAQYVSGKTSHLAALPVTYFDGKLYNVDEEDKALIEWDRAVVDGKATFSNNSKYLTGKSDKTDLTLAATSCNWTISEDSYLIGARTFLYNAENNWFRNFGTSNAGNQNYSDMPTVTAPVYATGDITYTRNVTNKYGTICLPYASASTTGAYFYRVAGKEEGSKVYLESVDALEAGVPYIFEATAGTITVTCQGEAVDAPQNDDANGLIGTFTNETEVPDGMYILYQGAFCTSDNPANPNKVNAYRAYLNMNAVTGDAPQQMPGRRYIGMDVEGENEATGFENITNGENTTIKVIENGQLIIIRNGVKYNVQGVRL